MALTKISTGGVKDDAASQAKIADEAVDEARLQVSNAGTNGQFLSKQTGNTGGLTWSDGASEGTEVKSTGESGTAKFLRVDGDGTSSWQVPPDTVYTHPNHSGEVTSTGDGATVIASNVVDEDNLKVSNTPTNGQVLSAQSGNTGGLTWTTISAAPEVTLTASGTVTAEKAAMIKSDGTVETVTGVSLSNGSTTQIRSITNGDSADQSASAFGNGKFVVLYAVDNNLYAKAATLSGTTFSFGSELHVTNDLAGNPYNTFDVCYDSNADKFVCVWSTTTSKAVGRVLSVSGTTLSQGTKADIYNNPSTYYVQETMCIFDPSVNKVCAVYNIGSNKLCQAKAGTVSGTSISWGGGQEVDDGSGNVNNVNLAYDSKNQNIYVVWRYSSSQGRISKITYNSSTGQYPRTKAVSVWLSSAPSGPIGIVAIPNTDKVYVNYISSNVGKMRLLEGNSSGWSEYTEYTLGSGSGNFGKMTRSVGIDTVNERILTFNRDNGGLAKMFKQISYNTSTNALAIESTTTIDSNSGWNVSFNLSQDTANNKLFLHWGYNTSDDIYQAIAYQLPSSNLNADRFIGFAASTVTNGNSVAIKVASNTSTQSSLTPASKYFVQGTGTIATTAANPSVEAGIALSSTKLLIKG